MQRIKAETKTAGGIFLPESSVKELNEARVLAVGPGGLDKEGKRVAPSVQAGDKVLIPQYGGSPVKVGDEEYALFRDYEYVDTHIIVVLFRSVRIGLHLFAATGYHGPKLSTYEKLTCHTRLLAKINE